MMTNAKKQQQKAALLACSQNSNDAAIGGFTVSKTIDMSKIKFDKAEHEDQKARWEITCPKYKAELEELQKHYGIRCTLDSMAQAEWDRDGALARLTVDQSMWLRIEAARDVCGAGFAILIHKYLAQGKSAKEVTEILGTFDDWVKAWVNIFIKGIPDIDIYPIRKSLLKSRRWHHEYS